MSVFAAEPAGTDMSALLALKQDQFEVLFASFSFKKKNGKPMSERQRRRNKKAALSTKGTFVLGQHLRGRSDSFMC